MLNRAIVRRRNLLSKRTFESTKCKHPRTCIYTYHCIHYTLNTIAARIHLYSSFVRMLRYLADVVHSNVPRKLFNLIQKWKPHDYQRTYVALKINAPDTALLHFSSKQIHKFEKTKTEKTRKLLSTFPTNYYRIRNTFEPIIYYRWWYSTHFSIQTVETSRTTNPPLTVPMVGP